MRFGRGRKSGSGFLNLPYTGSRLPGEGEMGGFNSAFSGRTMSSLGTSSGPMTTSLGGDYGPVLAARRQAKLAAADPGLSTRGRVNAPGRATRPVTGGLETRGVRPAAGTRSTGRSAKVSGMYGPPRPKLPSGPMYGPPSPMLGPGRREMVGANVRANVAASEAVRRERTIRANVAASRSARGGMTGRQAALARAPMYGPPSPMLGPGRPEMIAANVRANVARSQAARGGRSGAVTAALRGATAEQRAGAQSILDNMRARASIPSTPVSVRPRTPVVSAPGSPPSPPDPGSKGIRKALDGALDYAKKKPGRTALIAGAGAIGLGALLGGREKRGTSSGSQGMYRY